MTTFDATYDPADNKIRLRASGRLEPELYARARAAGFIWAPKQELFVAPKWTPEREDLAIELAGELDDEDTSLVDRAEERAERFEGYSEKRGAEAEGARGRVDAIADNIPLGQPILVGHHSERRARKDAERIRSGIDKAVKLWQTSKYWTARAAGALRHAKYKELPAVRARRIKTLEAEQRSEERRRDKAEKFVRLWAGLEAATWTKGGQPTTFEERADHLADLDWALFTASKGLTAVEKRDHAIAAHERTKAYAERCIEHLTNRLAYERAMLAESGYVPPPKPKSKATLPLLNYSGAVSYRNPYHRGEVVTAEAVGITKAQLAAIGADYKGTRISTDGTHRVRTAMLRRPGDTGANLHIVYLTDSKQHERPAALPAPVVDLPPFPPPTARARVSSEPDPRDQDFTRLRDQLRAGVRVVSAPQLFPTPAGLAARMVERAALREGDRVLEPSAGTGNIVRAILDAKEDAGLELGVLVAVEVDEHLAKALDAAALADVVDHGDFLTTTAGDLDGAFDRIIMNPPFANGADIKHVLHALDLLAPGGRLVAVVADGPRQQERLRPVIEGRGGTWEALPADSFKEQGTSVRTALIVVEARS
jgi:predicted RNA methylase